ncbi:MAG: LamG-like jellyroll fold domain-containing protein [Candidatus Microsaccharimonas sp.]
MNRQWANSIRERQADKGFTVVELILVVAVIAILAIIIIIAYGNWRGETVTTTVKSDLLNAAAAMESAATFNDVYPADASSVYTSSEGSDIAGGAISDTSYCVSITNGATSFFITKDKVPLPGTCPMLYYDPSTTQSYSGSGMTIKDLSGNKNDAVFRNALTDNVAGPTYVADDSGGVLAFDGDDKYISNAAPTYGPNNTWTACAKTEQSISSHNMFMGTYFPYFGTYAGGTGMVFSTRISGSQRTVASTTPATPLNTWVCYVFTTEYNGTNTTISAYMNGVLRSSATYAGQQDNLGHKYTVGDGYPSPSSTGTWLPFKGRIGDVGVYPRAFGAEEVKAYFESLRAKYRI